MQRSLSRREFMAASLAVAASRGHADPAMPDVHRQLLAIAAEQEKQRRARFAAVKTPADLESLQKELRQKFLTLIDGLPTTDGPPPVKKLSRIEAEDYTVDKLVYESFPGYFVSAVLYLPKKRAGAVPGILSPCGHAAVGKASPTYQILHINLAKRGYAVLCYDPVGQGERSQFWNTTQGRSKYDLQCGEHCVLGNPLYLLGTSLARYRTWDGMRGIDYLCSLSGVDPKRIGCVGASGGGTLTSYIAALDPRVAVAVPVCYITTLPRRMGNRIERDPDSDPEQDIAGFVSEGIDHAGLLALRAPKPTLLGAAIRDFFPIEGARETANEMMRLYDAAGAPEKFSKVEADERHGLTLNLRQGAYRWFDRWLGNNQASAKNDEIPVVPRPVKDLLTCTDAQVNVTFRSKPLLPMALAEFRKRKPSPKVPLKELLNLDPEHAHFRLASIEGKAERPYVICLNGNESSAWKRDDAFLKALATRGFGVSIVDTRGVGSLRPAGLEVKGRSYEDALCGVEENIAYNAFLVGKNLLGMRVADVRKAVAKVKADAKPATIVVCGRRDAGLVALFATAMEPLIDAVAVEETLMSFIPTFDAEGRAINAASVLPRILRDFGDIWDVLRSFSPRKVLASVTRTNSDPNNLQQSDKRFTENPDLFFDWLKGGS